MMTREEYMSARNAIERQMMESKSEERKAISMVTDEYEVKLHRHYEEYQKQRRAIFIERDEMRDKVHAKYRDRRCKLYQQENDLIEQWRNQQKEASEIEEGGTQAESHPTTISTQKNQSR